MTSAKVKVIEGLFQHVVYSPHGGIEGILLTVDGAPVQVVFPHGDEETPRRFLGLAVGQRLALDAVHQGESPKGPADHAVYGFAALRSIDGKKPGKAPLQDDGAYIGSVVRLNHARHGAPNGVVLDTGDFIHMRPDGMALLKLKPGDRVRAYGDAYLLSSGQGWAVEATEVNGKKIKR
jgi:hypothetical protein